MKAATQTGGKGHVENLSSYVFGEGFRPALYSNPVRAQFVQNDLDLHAELAEAYTHVSTKAIGKIRSPLDNLDL